MKRNKHTNVAAGQDITTAGSQTAGMELIMKAADGSLVKATGVQLAPEYKALAERLQREKGVSKESAEIIAASATIWTPDMVGEKTEEKPKKKRTPRKKKEVLAEETSKEEKKPAKKPRKKKETVVDETPKVEEKPKKKRVARKKVII